MADFYFLQDESDDFPSPSKLGLTDLAVIGSNLKPETIVKAYKKGYFPWYNEGDPRCWYHPDPRMVLFPDNLVVSKSMRSVLNGNKFRLQINKNFPQVIRSCRNVSRWNGEKKSWITEEFIESYEQLFKDGYVHCAEAWHEGKMVGGLYGVLIGKIFFGESMFSTESNASKFAFIKFVRFLQKKGVQLIDCQQETPHLASLGARSIPRKQFVSYLEKLISENDNVW